MEEGCEGTTGEAGWWWKLRVERVPGWKSHRSLQLKTLWKYREGISSLDLEENYWPQSFLPSASCRHYQDFNLLSKELSQQCLIGGAPAGRFPKAPGESSSSLAWLLSWTAKSQRRSQHSHQNPSRSLGQFHQCSVNAHSGLTSLPQAQKHKIREVLLPSDCSQIHTQIIKKREKNPKHNKGYENQPKLPNSELSQSPAWDCHSCQFRF